MEIKKEVQLKANYKVTKCGTEMIAHIVAKETINQYEEQISEKEYLRLVRKSLHAAGENRFKKMRCDLSKKGIPKKYGIESFETHNIVPLLIRSELANLIAGNAVTPTFIANYMALGSGVSAPTNSDIHLQTETVRGLITNAETDANIVFLDKFRTQAEVAGNTYLEAGIFIDGEAGADTGFLLSRISMNEELSLYETLTINATITIV